MATGYAQSDQKLPEWLRADLRERGARLKTWSGPSEPRRKGPAKFLPVCPKCGETHRSIKCQRVDAKGALVP